VGVFGTEQVGTMGTIFKTKEVKMKWFKRWLARMVSDGLNDSECVPTPMTSSRGLSKLISRGDDDHLEGLNITVRSAMGGRIVSFRHYDQKIDRHNTRLYVVPEDMDFERELGKMITIESMRG
jgi:hypothetical protein